MKSFCMRYPGGKDRAMTFSYDDGTVHDLKLTEMMKQYGVKATLNLNSVCLQEKDGEQKHHLNFDEVRALADDPRFEIACHGQTHPYYNLLPSPVILNDILADRVALENITGKITRGFAYPYGTHNETSQLALRQAGIVYARVTAPVQDFSLPENWLVWHPTCHHRAAPELYDVFAKKQALAKDAILFYVWGHSYEFSAQHNDNWDLMEGLLERCANNPDIWFATNMEIYEYVSAFRSLIFSADGSMVRNPSGMMLWAEVNGHHAKAGEIVELPAGQTVVLE